MVESNNNFKIGIFIFIIIILIVFIYLFVTYYIENKSKEVYNSILPPPDCNPDNTCNDEKPSTNCLPPRCSYDVNNKRSICPCNKT